MPAIRALDSLERVPPRLVLADPDTARDVQTFVGRSAAAGNDGVRLQARGGILAVTSAALAPRSMFDHTPTVLAMRIVHADPELECDIVVQEVTASEQSHVLLLPDTGLAPSWAGVSPPRSGWAPRGALDAATIAQRAQWGISAVARGAGTGSPEEAVRALRASIWGEADDDLLALPRGVAFAAHAFGFISGDERVAVTQSGRWTRLTFRRGHVLSRGPAVSGLTAVRDTGAAEASPGSAV